MLRKFSAIVLGLIAGGLIVGIVEIVGSTFHRIPQGLDINDTEALREHARAAPVSVKIIVIVGWTLAAFIGGALSTLIAGDKKNIYALICASVFLVFTIVNLTMIPSPLWFWILGILVWFPFSLLGYNFVKNRS